MNLSDISATQLRQAASIKEQIEKLQKELTNLLGAPTAPPAPIAAPKKKGKMSAAARKKLSDFHKARWAKIKQASKPAKAAKKKKSTMSAAGLANIRAAQKARWAKIKKAKTSKVTLARKAASKTAPAATPAPKKKWRLSAAGLARIKAANKAYWAKKKAAKK